MIGYCVKDNGEEHFEFVHDNVSANDTNDGKMEYAKLGKVGLDNSASLSHYNVLQRGPQRACLCMKKHFGATFVGTLYHVCKNSQFYLDPAWVIPLNTIFIKLRVL